MRPKPFQRLTIPTKLLKQFAAPAVLFSTGLKPRC